MENLDKNKSIKKKKNCRMVETTNKVGRKFIEAKLLFTQTAL